MKNQINTRNLILIWLGSMLLLSVFNQLRFVSFFDKYLSLFSCLILVYVPMLVTWKKPIFLPLFDRSKQNAVRSIKYYLLTCLLIFPILIGLNHFFQSWVFHQGFSSVSKQSEIVFKILKEAPYQLLLVALPEEFFYRSFMQGILNDNWGKKWTFLGAKFGKSLIITSLLFALSHSLISFAWWHFAIFFPSLVFGWLKEKTGSLTASILFHASANLFSLWVANSYISQ